MAHRQGERMLFRGLPEILALDNATDPAEDQGASGRVVHRGANGGS